MNATGHGINNQKFYEIVDKYSPSGIDDILNLDHSDGMELVSYAKSCFMGTLDDPRCYLLVGPSGVGKTATAYALGLEVGADVIEVNASSKRTENEFKKVIDTYLSNVGVSIVDENEVIFLIDEVDGLFRRSDVNTRDAASCISELVQSKSIPVIITANSEYDAKDKLSALVSRDWVKLMRYDAINATKMRKLIKKINRRENLGLSSSQMMKIARASGGDVRQMYDLLLLPDELRTETVISDEITIFDILDSVYGSDNADELYRKITSADYDIGFILSWIFENVTVYTGSKDMVSRLYQILADNDRYIDRRVTGGDRWQNETFIRKFCYELKDVMGRGYDTFRRYDTPLDFEMYRKRSEINKIVDKLRYIFTDDEISERNFKKRLSFMRDVIGIDEEYRYVVGNKIYRYVCSEYGEDDKDKRKKEFVKIISYLGHDMLEDSKNAEDLWDSISSGSGVELSKDIDKMKDDELPGEDDEPAEVDVEDVFDMM